MPTRRFLLVVSLLSTFLLAGCSRFCTAAGCTPEAALIQVDRTASTSQLADGLFRICRNDRCSESAIRIAGNDLIFGETRRDDLSLQLAGQQLGTRVVISVPSYDLNELADGDEYSLQLIDRMGAVVEEWHWVADYTETYPNGSDCDDIPCRRVELD